VNAIQYKEIFEKESPNILSKNEIISDDKPMLIVVQFLYLNSRELFPKKVWVCYLGGINCRA
jgi:hypothetical protein